MTPQQHTERNEWETGRCDVKQGVVFRCLNFPTSDFHSVRTRFIPVASRLVAFPTPATTPDPRVFYQMWYSGILS
jgi:hypothetical protein